MTATIACFGEILLRLSPPHGQMLKQARSLDLHVGGGEANVAVALANIGLRTRIISALPDNSLGDISAIALSSQGVDVSSIVRTPGRMGTYIYTPGSGARQGEVLYDRQGSAFARCGADNFDFDIVLEGATHLHISGISLALSASIAEATLHLAQNAKEKGMSFSYDGNFRPALWAMTERKPRQCITELVKLADVFFGNHKDASLLLSKNFSGDGSVRRREAAMAIFEHFPNLTMIASTARHVDRGNIHRLRGRIDTKEQTVQSEEFHLMDVADRIGTGDAFAAGVLDGWLEDSSAHQTALDRGMGLSALKHATLGDFSLSTRSDLDAFIAGGGDVKR